MLRLILVNLKNTIVLAAVLFLCIPLISSTAKLITRTFFPDEDSRARLINYEKLPWAKQHFKEFNDLDIDYFGYVAWRRKPFAGSTITIDPVERIRITPPIPGLSEHRTYFFGGSTMWGSGSTDDTTIPAYYQQVAREIAVNYGESGWTAHQSLNQLMKLVAEGRKPANVVFYDGANEIAHKCRVENNFFSHSNESRIDDALEYKPTELGYYARPVISVARSLAADLAGVPKHAKFYDCTSDARKADLVAEALVQDWLIARQVTELGGGRFTAFLQPIAYLSKSRLTELKLDEDLGEQFKAVYPLIRAKMIQRGIGVDLSTVLDRDEFYFIDFCHVSPNGNEAVARAMKEALSPPPTQSTTAN
ncbi:MAG: hypothetical protein AB7S92_03275 [Parvibaculaceae bacterium]